MQSSKATFGGPLASNSDPSSLGPDLTVCDREPIHIPGSIQPHGLLLIVDAETARVVAGAGDLEERLSPDWHGSSLSLLVGKDAAVTALSVGDTPVWLGEIGRPTDRFDAIASRSGAYILVELEPASAGIEAATVLSTLDRLGASFERTADLPELCGNAAVAFRQLTGFDRVMVYRFLDDEAGVVLAEDRDPTLGSFLNHHFPASDIPRQARALYVRNRVRVIPDVAYQPSPLRPESADVAELDLSDVALRSVSPVHVQYLRNMGVGASASVSIVRDGVLWGLIACHNETPRTMSYSTRLTCRTLASSLARQIKAREEAGSYRERIRLHSAEDAILARLDHTTSFDEFLRLAGGDIAKMLGADGFAAFDGQVLGLAGHGPQESDIKALAGWAKARAGSQPFSTRELSQLYPAASSFGDKASGLIAVMLSPDDPIVLLWFRAEEIETVNWAGNPHKAIDLAAGETLTPRASFEDWSEIVRGRSRPWTLEEVDAANRFRNELAERRQTQRIRELNRELTVTIADREGLIKQKDYLIKEVNHRVQNSLQLVSAFLHMQGRAAGDPTLIEHLAEAQRRLSAVALVHRRLYGDDLVETVDLARYFEELTGDLKSSMGPDWAQNITVDLSPMLVPADRAVNAGLILTELVINAQKYAYGGAPGPIFITLEQDRNRFRLIVADRGAGKSKARQGFGTRMLNAMIDRLGGSMDEESRSNGLRVTVTAPVQAA